jgi:hypothetical protein
MNLKPIFIVSVTVILFMFFTGCGNSYAVGFGDKNGLASAVELESIRIFGEVSDAAAKESATTSCN